MGYGASAAYSLIPLYEFSLMISIGKYSNMRIGAIEKEGAPKILQVTQIPHFFTKEQAKNALLPQWHLLFMALDGFSVYGGGFF
jgi:hypothetical protein